MAALMLERTRPDSDAHAMLTFLSAAGIDQVQLEVTDGWYGVRATIDGPLCHYVASGVLRTGIPFLTSFRNGKSMHASVHVHPASNEGGHAPFCDRDRSLCTEIWVAE